MDIFLPRDLQELVERKLAAGEYESASDMVVEALYLLAARDRFVETEREQLRREIMLGLDQCERGEVVDADEVFAELRERLSATKTTAT